MKAGFADAIGFPALILVSTMTGIGSIARDADFGAFATILSTLLIWGAPGQVVMVELYQAGAGLLPLALGVGLANARFFPMTAALLPKLFGRQPGSGFSLLPYLCAQMVSINTWAFAMREAVRLPPKDLRVYFLTFASVVMTAALLGSAIGYYGAAGLPSSLKLVLLMLTPLYFGLVVAAPGDRAGALALIFGALAGPPAHLLNPDFGLLVAGAVAGCLAFWIGEASATKS